MFKYKKTPLNFNLWWDGNRENPSRSLSHTMATSVNCVIMNVMSEGHAECMQAATRGQSTFTGQVSSLGLRFHTESTQHDKRTKKYSCCCFLFEDSVIFIWQYSKRRNAFFFNEQSLFLFNLHLASILFNCGPYKRLICPWLREYSLHKPVSLAGFWPVQNLPVRWIKHHQAPQMCHIPLH